MSTISEVILRKIVEHLTAAVQQSIPSDDQTIMDHVRAAHELATTLHQARAQ